MNQTNDKNPKSEANQITEGVIWKQLMLFFFPIVVGTFFQQLYNTVDAIVVGQVAGQTHLPVSAVPPDRSSIWSLASSPDSQPEPPL